MKVSEKQSKQICPKFAKLCPPPPPPSSTEFPLLYMCCNIHHFGITKRKVTASKLQVMASKLEVTAPKLQITRTKLQVTRSKLTSLTAETNKFQLTNMLFSNFLKRCFECTVNGSLQMVVFQRYIAKRKRYSGQNLPLAVRALEQFMNNNSSDSQSD